MSRLESGVRSAVRRLEHEAALWRDEPIRRVAVRNRVVHPWRERRFHHFGEHSFVDRPEWIYGPQQIWIGDLVMILAGSWLAVERVAWDRPAPVMRIGNRVAVRVSCTLSAAESVIIEDDVAIGCQATVIDSRHTWATGVANPMYSPVKSAPVHIGRGSWIADRATVAAGADIGEQCAIGPGAVVSSRVPDFSIVLGNPGRVVGSTRV